MTDDKLRIRPKYLRGEDGYRTFSIRIKDDIVSELEIISDRTGRSRNELISILLRYALDRCEIDDAEMAE